MSTDGALQVPISLLHEQTALRLVELPAELVEHVSHGRRLPLHFKSGPTDQDARNTGPLPLSLAVLCTESTTYELKQVQTSNTVFIARPFPVSRNDEDGIQAPGVEVFAECGNTIELHSVTANAMSPVYWLEELLPIYSRPQRPKNSSTYPQGRAQVFADVPFSLAECNAAWASLLAFELQDSEQLEAYRPSPHLLLSVWRDFARLVDVENLGLNLDTNALAVELDCPAALLESMLSFLGTSDGTGNVTIRALDKAKTTQWLIGLFDGVYIEGQAQELPSGDRQFIEELWTPLWPEVWETNTEAVETLVARYRQANAARTGGNSGKSAPASQKRPESKTTGWLERIKQKRAKT